MTTLIILSEQTYTILCLCNTTIHTVWWTQEMIRWQHQPQKAYQCITGEHVFHVKAGGSGTKEIFFAELGVWWMWNSLSFHCSKWVGERRRESESEVWGGEAKVKWRYWLIFPIHLCFIKPSPLYSLHKSDNKNWWKSKVNWRRHSQWDVGLNPHLTRWPDKGEGCFSVIIESIVLVCVQERKCLHMLDIWHC